MTNKYKGKILECCIYKKNASRNNNIGNKKCTAKNASVKLRAIIGNKILQAMFVKLNFGR